MLQNPADIVLKIYILTTANISYDFIKAFQAQPFGCLPISDKMSCFHNKGSDSHQGVQICDTSSSNHTHSHKWHVNLYEVDSITPIIKFL